MHYQSQKIWWSFCFIACRTVTNSSMEYPKNTSWFCSLSHWQRAFYCFWWKYVYNGYNLPFALIDLYFFVFLHRKELIFGLTPNVVVNSCQAHSSQSAVLPVFFPRLPEVKPSLVFEQEWWISWKVEVFFCFVCKYLITMNFSCFC